MKSQECNLIVLCSSLLIICVVSFAAVFGNVRQRSLQRKRCGERCVTYEVDCIKCEEKFHLLCCSFFNLTLVNSNNISQAPKKLWQTAVKLRNFIFNKWLASAINHSTHTQTIKHVGNVVLVSSFRPIGFYDMSAMLSPEGSKPFLFFCPPHVDYVL